MTPPIPVPADGTQTKCPDSAINQDKEEKIPSQGNPPSTLPPDPRHTPQDFLNPGSLTLGQLGGGGREDRPALRTQGE